MDVFVLYDEYDNSVIGIFSTYEKLIKFLRNSWGGYGNLRYKEEDLNDHEILRYADCRYEGLKLDGQI